MTTYKQISTSEQAYKIYDAEEAVEIKADFCGMNCRYCKQIDGCEYGMYSNSL